MFGRIKDMKLRYKIGVGVATGAAVIGGGSMAFAYWTSTGTGAGSATTGTAASTLSFTDGTAITDMAPGVAAESINGLVKNTQSTGGQYEYVNSVTASIASVSETTAAKTAWGDPATKTTGSKGTYYCTASDYTLSNPTMSVGTDLAPGASASFSGATIAFNDNASQNQDACQGATVNLTYTSN